MEVSLYARDNFYDINNKLIFIKHKRYTGNTDDGIYFLFFTETKDSMEFTSYGGESDENIKDIYKFFLTKKENRSLQLDALISNT